MKHNDPRELRAERADIITQAESLVDTADKQKRDLTRGEKATFDGLVARAKELAREIKQAESGFGNFDILKSRSAVQTRDGWVDADGIGGILSSRQAPYMRTAHPLTGEERALQEWVLRGDVSELLDGDADTIELRATDSTMNIGTAADGGNAVPTGLFNQIVLRRNESLLARKLGVRMIDGEGTTVNVAVENADPNVFATTSEQDDAHNQDYERDAMQLDKAAMTLVKKTKKLEVTEELWDDEAAGLTEAIVDHISRAQADTHNAMLLTEVAANGTSLKTFASATAIAAGEPEDIVFNDTLAYYLENPATVGWVMRPTSLGDIQTITGNDRQYAAAEPANVGTPTLLTYPVYYSNNAAAIGASAKSVYFGAWNSVGLREAPTLRLIRDPYTVDGLIILKYSFRAVYKVLQSGGVGYGEHPSA